MKNLWKIFQLFELVLNKHVAISDLFRKNFSIASSVLVSRIKDFSTSFDVIIDVGANEGQFALSARRYFPDSRIISFEPDPITFQKLQNNLSGHKQVQAYNYALGDSIGNLPFYRNKDSQTSSILPGINNHSNFKHSKQNIINVEVKPLEEFLKNELLHKSVLLKLDVQGYEKKVLEGCGALINQIEFILLEVSFKKSYQGEPSFDELNSLLRENGFRLLMPLNFLNQGIEITQADLLYRRI